jgi:hypothetical protein
VHTVNTFLRTSTLAAALAAAPAAASAQSIPQIDVAGGYVSTTDGSASLAAIATLHGPGIGLPGIAPQLSVALPFVSGGGRYAATAEGAAHFAGGFSAGGGIGIGRLNAPLTTGVLYDLFAAKSVAPHVDIVARYYDGLNQYTGQALFAGVALRL